MFPHSQTSHAFHASDPRFVGELLSEPVDAELPWWLRAFSHRPIQIGRHGELSPRLGKEDLPLRHGQTAAGAPARCRLASGVDLDRLRSGEAGAADGDAEGGRAACAACAAWAAWTARQERARRLRDAGALERVLCALRLC
jgi:hypothetical protein